jgi:hypothetical protein
MEQSLPSRFLRACLGRGAPDAGIHSNFGVRTTGGFHKVLSAPKIPAAARLIVQDQ